MILVDANLLLYAYDASAREHARAKAWLEDVLSHTEQVGFAWVTILAFLRIATNPRALASPLAPDEAVSIVESWLAQPCVVVVSPGERHWSVLGAMLARDQVRGPLVMDAHLAALALEQGAVLATHDRDFARFNGLRTVMPLVG
ncbi:MAG: PIN domain-containing protein [Anaeromyxobacter sp.]|nr:PIN domain-containing protein [Anaeromyxobacter sp.]MBL0274871.1 PIN domain-containing protein [Anaeromyxobacter sp.]